MTSELREDLYRIGDIHPGDWVRFEQDEELIIAQVEYVNGTILVTDEGSVPMEEILEVRKGPR